MSLLQAIREYFRATPAPPDQIVCPCCQELYRPSPGQLDSDRGYLGPMQRACEGCIVHLASGQGSEVHYESVGPPECNPAGQHSFPAHPGWKGTTACQCGARVARYERTAIAGHEYVVIEPLPTPAPPPGGPSAPRE